MERRRCRTAAVHGSHGESMWSDWDVSKPAHHRITNWSSYTALLCKRGSVQRRCGDAKRNRPSDLDHNLDLGVCPPGGGHRVLVRPCRPDPSQAVRCDRLRLAPVRLVPSQPFTCRSWPPCPARLGPHGSRPHDAAPLAVVARATGSWGIPHRPSGLTVMEIAVCIDLSGQKLEVLGDQLMPCCHRPSRSCRDLLGQPDASRHNPE